MMFIYLAIGAVALLGMFALARGWFSFNAETDGRQVRKDLQTAGNAVSKAVYDAGDAIQEGTKDLKDKITR